MSLGHEAAGFLVIILATSHNTYGGRLQISDDEAAEGFVVIPSSSLDIIRARGSGT